VTRTAADTRPQLVIFDLDGTLTDSADGIVSSFRHALGVVGAEVPAGDLPGRIVGPPMHITLQGMGLGLLEHFGLTGHFDVIAGASVGGSRSSKADVLAHALDQLSPLPDPVVMVGDRAHDVEGAAEHGIDTVVVGWGYGAADFRDPEVAAAATAHVPTVSALREVLGV